MNAAIGINPALTHTSPLYALGTLAQSYDGKVFIYVQADGAITGDGYVVSISNAFQAIMTDTDTAATVAEGRKVGVADAAFADNEYGWVQVYGPCGIRSEQEALANAFLGPTADAGQIDDAAATGNFIFGMHFQTATGGADAVNATGFLNYPVLTVRMEPET